MLTIHLRRGDYQRRCPVSQLYREFNQIPRTPWQIRPKCRPLVFLHLPIVRARRNRRPKSQRKLLEAASTCVDMCVAERTKVFLSFCLSLFAVCRFFLWWFHLLFSLFDVRLMNFLDGFVLIPATFSSGSYVAIGKGWRYRMSRKHNLLVLDPHQLLLTDISLMDYYLCITCHVSCLSFALPHRRSRRSRHLWLYVAYSGTVIILLLISLLLPSAENLCT